MSKRTSSPRKPKPISSLEERFIRLWAEVAAASPKLTTLEAEVRLPPRQFRWDFLIRGTNVLVEVNGGTHSRRRLGHSTGVGIGRDYEKLNYCQFKGYQCFIFDVRQVNKHNLENLYVYICKRYPHLA